MQFTERGDKSAKIAIMLRKRDFILELHQEKLQAYQKVGCTTTLSNRVNVQFSNSKDPDLKPTVSKQCVCDNIF